MQVSVLDSSCYLLQLDFGISELKVAVVLVLTETELAGPPVSKEDPLASLLVVVDLNLVKGVVDALTVLLVLVLHVRVFKKVLVFSLEHALFTEVGMASVDVQRRCLDHGSEQLENALFYLPWGQI